MDEIKIEVGLIILDEFGRYNEGRKTIIVVGHRGKGGNDPYWTCFIFSPYHETMASCFGEKKFYPEELMSLKKIGHICDFLWININVKTPPHDTGILITDGNSITLCELYNFGTKLINSLGLCGHGFYGHDLEFDFKLEDITHWKLLPVLPNKEKRNE